MNFSSGSPFTDTWFANSISLPGYNCSSAAIPAYPGSKAWPPGVRMAHEGMNPNPNRPQ